MNELELACFQIITKSGVAKSNYAQALGLARTNEFDKALEFITAGEKEFLEGHKFHAELVQKEASGEKVELSLILMHAEDQLMSTDTYKSMVLEMIELYKIINQLKMS